MPINPPTSLPSNYFRGYRNIVDGELANRLNAALLHDGSTRVESADDLPDAVAGVITLPPGLYQIIGAIDIGTNQLATTSSGVVTLLGLDRDHDSIISAHPDEAIRVATSFRMKNIRLDNTVGDGILSTTSADITMEDALVIATSVGKVAYKSLAGGASLMFIHNVLFSGGLFGVQVGGTALRLRMHFCDVIASTGAVGNRALKIDASAVILVATMTNCRFRNGGDFSILVDSTATFTVPVHFIGCGADGFGTAGLDTGGKGIGLDLTVTATNDFV